LIIERYEETLYILYKSHKLNVIVWKL